MNKEIRNCNEITSLNPEAKVCEGYALVFNSDSKDLGGFTERINPTAMDGVIEKSLVLAVLNHNVDKGVLARSKYGEGSLTLEVDEIGLRYSFEIPDSPIGKELEAGLKRGDINTSSFCFTVEKETWTKRDDGSYLRTIDQIGQLFDVSPVYNEAYPSTTVALRSLDEFKKDETAKLEQLKAEARAQEIEDLKTNLDTFKAEGTKLELQDNLEQVERMLEGNEDDEKRNLITEKIDLLKTAIRNIDKNKEDNKKKEIRKMNKFSLIKTINDIVNNRNIDDAAQEVLNEGVQEMRKAGLSFGGQIQLPVAEERADSGNTIMATVATDGQEVVATEKLNILGPLRAKMVLAQAGATYLTGLVGNVSIPSYDGSTCGWAGEVDPAGNGKGSFDSVEFHPMRLTSYIDVSKQWLNQDSCAANELLMKDIVESIASKLEATILGNEAGTNNKPEGMFNGVSGETLTYDGIVGMEETLENANVNGEFKFIMNPSIKAALKTTTISGSKSDLRMIMQDNEVNGYGVLSTSAAKGIVLGDFSEYVICQWGSLDLTVDPYTQAANGCIRLVINAYFDAKPRRAEAFVKKVKA